MYFSNRWLELRVYAREWTKPVGAVVASFALAICLFLVLYQQTVHELRGATVKYGYATVERVALTSKGSNSFDLMRVLTLRVNGDDVIFPTQTAFSAGEVVRVRYRIGKSGKIYVGAVYSATDR
jgi:hypothetical protein